MNKLNLIWIIPLCIILGFSIGLYYSIPQNYTIDYGENIVQVMNQIEDINSIKINKTGIILNCSYDRFKYCENGAIFQLTEDYPNMQVIKSDTWDSIQLYCDKITKDAEQK